VLTGGRCGRLAPAAVRHEQGMFAQLAEEGGAKGRGARFRGADKVHNRIPFEISANQNDDRRWGFHAAGVNGFLPSEAI